MEQQEYMTIDQVASKLQVSRQTVYDYINRTEKPLIVIYLGDKTPRIKKTDLETWVESNKTNI